VKSIDRQNSTRSGSETNTTRIGSRSSRKLSLRKSSHDANLNYRKIFYTPFGEEQQTNKLSIYPIMTSSKLPLIEKNWVVTAKERPLVNLQVAHRNMNPLLS